MVEFNVYVPSYKRSCDKVRMYDHLEYCTYVVRKSEEALYRAAGIHDIWAVDDALICNIHKVHDYIIQNSPEDVICLVDDDGFFTYRNITSYSMTNEQASYELERIAQLLVDLKLGFACTGPSPVPYNYISEFKFLGVPGGCKWVNKSAFKARIDPLCEYNFDSDLVLQELIGNRIILNPLYFIDVGGQDTNAGGSNTDKNMTKFNAGVEYTKNKWGSHFAYKYENHKARIVVER